MPLTLDVQHLSAAETPAPALNRGLAVLAALCQEAPQSLDVLAGRLGLPKASVYRFLTTLQQVGLVQKTPDKRYEPLWALQPLADERTLLRAAVSRSLETLCDATGCTVEWYEPGPDGLRLELQSNPDTELCVKVRPGFVRVWGGEFEAVLRLGYAFASMAPPLGEGLQTHTENGKLAVQSPAACKEMLTQCHRDRATIDPFFNSNGVRRCASAVFARAGGAFLGVLALAEGFHFSRKAEQAEYARLISQAASGLP